MHYLIDGHNLIAAMPDISLADPDDEVKLILILRSWAVARRKREVTVVFDGGLPGGYEQRLSTSRIHVIFASGGRTADSILIGRVKKVPNPPQFNLVSSDRAVQAAATARKLAVLTSDEFAKRLQEVEAPPKPKPQGSSEPILSSAEVAEWMDLFGPEPEIKPPPKPATRKKSIRKKKSNPTSQDRNPTTAKSGDRKLSGNEIDEWMDLFQDGKK
jgi:predicted RNA-binding protein with PIN domain